MSNTGEWKNDRAEAEMRRHEAEMMAKLNPKEEKFLRKQWTITATAVGQDSEGKLNKFKQELDEFLGRIDGVTATASDLV